MVCDGLRWFTVIYSSFTDVYSSFTVVYGGFAVVLPWLMSAIEQTGDSN